MNPDLAFLSASPSAWLDLRRLVELQVAEMPPNSWRPSLPYTSPEQQSDPKYIMQCLMDSFAQNASTVVKAVCHRHTLDEWPRLSPQQTYYLRQMHGRILIFLQGIVLQSKGQSETVFPFPQSSGEGKRQNAHLKDVLFWFLTDWWIEHGLPEIVYETSHRTEPPPFEFSKS